MRNYFILDGVDSRDYGVYISGQGTFSAPQKAYTFYNVPGRNGAILGNEHRLENIEVSYEAFIYTDFDNNIAKFRTFLLSLNGYVKLIDSYHPDEYRYAVYTGPFNPEVTKMNDAGSFVITFNCKPQRYLISGDTTMSWVNGGSAELTGQIVTAFAPELDTTVLDWEYERHGVSTSVVSGSRPSDTKYTYTIHYADTLALNVVADDFDGSTTYALPNVTKASADLIAGTLTYYASVIQTPTTGWTLYDTNIFRVSVSGWSAINAARRWASHTGAGGVGGIYTVMSSLAELISGTNYSYSCCLDSGYLYVKDTAYATASEFMAGKAGFLIDRTLATAQTVSLTPYVPNYPYEFITVSGNNGEYETFSLEYANAVNASMANPTAFPSTPLIRAYGNGSFIMDGVTITITNATAYTDVDCELMDCYEGTTNRNNDVSFSTYDFPMLQPGDNEITIVSGISAIDIKPRWWRV